MTIIPREHYDHPGPLGPALNLAKVTGWDIHHTAGSLTEAVRDLAKTGVQRFGRSSYNFVIDRHGHVYEMQGLHVGAHNDGENSTRLGLCFIGYYHPTINHQPTDAQLEAAAALIRFGEQAWNVPTHIKGHRDTDSTACPGDHLYSRLNDITSLVRSKPMATEHDHDLTSLPSWAKKNWDIFVKNGVTSVPDSWKRLVHRADLAWIYAETILPLRDRITTLEGEVARLKQNGTGASVAEHTHVAGKVKR